METQPLLPSRDVRRSMSQAKPSRMRRRAERLWKADLQF